MIKTHIKILPVIFFISCLVVLPTICYSREIDLNVPKSEILFSQMKNNSTVLPSFVEINLSSWTPSHLDEPSNLDNTSSFTSSGAPKLTINFVIHPWLTLQGPLFLKLGGSFLKLQRQGYLHFERQNYFSRSQYLNCFEGHLSVEWISQKQYYWNSKPYLEGGITPVWLQAPSSSFGDGISHILWTARVSGGFSFNMPKLAKLLNLNTTDLFTGIESLQGLSKNQYSGTGLTLGSRITW